MTAQSRTETSRAVEVGEATAALEQTPAPAQAPHGTDAASSTASGAGAGLLREAAALMRERAENATPAPWEPYIRGTVITVGQDPNWIIIRPAGGNTADDARHIASWHPAVALAVADWLEAQADLHDDFVSKGLIRDWDAVDTDRSALAVAHAYMSGGDR